MLSLKTPGNRMIAMLFYSVLTFLVGPAITSKFVTKSRNQYLSGLILGFMLSLILFYNNYKNF